MARKVRTSKLVLSLGLSATIGVGAAFAQRGTKSEPDSELLKQVQQVSPQEMMTSSKNYMAQMSSAQKRAEELVEVARKKKDVVKLNCVNDKLTQMKAYNTLAVRAMENLTLANQQNNDEARRHEYTRMSILNQKVTVLKTEAENCVGEDASYVGATRVDVDVDPNIPQEDPTEPPIEVPVITRPPAASPFA
jgi:hypothetical protein